MLKIGQSVVCIDDAPPHEQHGAAYCLVRPKKGEIYTIRGVHTEPGIEGYGVLLEELVNPSIIWANGTEQEWPFDARRFRLTLLHRAVKLEAAATPTLASPVFSSPKGEA